MKSYNNFLKSLDNAIFELEKFMSFLASKEHCLTIKKGEKITIPYYSGGIFKDSLNQLRSVDTHIEEVKFNVNDLVEINHLNFSHDVVKKLKLYGSLGRIIGYKIECFNTGNLFYVVEMVNFPKIKLDALLEDIESLDSNLQKAENEQS